MFSLFRKVDVVACFKMEGHAMLAVREEESNYSVCVTSWRIPKFTLPTFSSVVKLIFEDMRKRYVIFRLTRDSDKFYL